MSGDAATPSYAVHGQANAELPTAVMRARLDYDEVGAWLPSAYRCVYAHLAACGIDPAGPPFARYEFGSGGVDVEVGVAVTTAIAGDDDVVPGRVPFGRVAVTTHVGPYEGLDDAVAAVDQWILEQGGEPAGPHWEVYLSDPETDEATWQTEVWRPYIA